MLQDAEEVLPKLPLYQPRVPHFHCEWEAAQSDGKNSDCGVRQPWVQIPALVLTIASVALGSLTPERLLFAHL